MLEKTIGETRPTPQPKLGQSAVYRLILDQALDALNNLANSDKLADLLFRGDYSDED